MIMKRISTYAKWSLMIFTLAIITRSSQVSTAQELLVDTLYKETQHYFESITKVVKDRGYIYEEAEKDKSVTSVKTYVQVATDSIVTILRNLEKDTASYNIDGRKQFVELQKDSVELAKLLRSFKLFQSAEKLHDMYLEGLKNLSDKLCDFIKINTLRRVVPYPLQSGAEEVYVQVIKITRAIQETVVTKKQ